MTDLEWKIKKYQLGHKNVFIGLHSTTEKKWVYQFKFNSSLELKTDRIYSITPYQQKIFDFFNSIEELDINSSDDNLQNQIKKDTQYINLNQVILNRYIREDVRKAIEENFREQEVDIIKLLLISRFLASAKLLGEQSLIQGLSYKDSLDIKLRCFAYRLLCYDLLLSSKAFHKEYQVNLLLAYFHEFDRFVTFIQENRFANYQLPDDLKKFLLQISVSKNELDSTKKEVHVDDLVKYLVDTFLETKTDFYSRLKQYEELKNLDVKVRTLESRLVRFFYLPRFALKEAKAHKKRLSFIDRINLKAPRLGASIIIGTIPIFITDEINQWAYRELDIYNKSAGVFDPSALILSLFIPVIVLFACWVYLKVEVHNFLGFQNKRKVMRLLRIGLSYSFIISFVLHLIFTSTFHADSEFNSNFSTDIRIFGRYFFLELFILQMSVSFFLGLVLQTIWEDKPITQPL